jgi:hypothetical protein
MTVANLIDLLKQHDTRVTVALWDHTAYGSHVAKLGFGEVHALQLGARERNGLLPLEVRAEGDTELQVPLPGVVLGGNGCVCCTWA